MQFCCYVLCLILGRRDYKFYYRHNIQQAKVVTNMNLTSRPDFRQYAKGRAVHTYFAGYEV
jgi:hypothetical protein